MLALFLILGMFIFYILWFRLIPKQAVSERRICVDPTPKK